MTRESLFPDRFHTTPEHAKARAQRAVDEAWPIRKLESGVYQVFRAGAWHYLGSGRAMEEALANVQ